MAESDTRGGEMQRTRRSWSLEEPPSVSDLRLVLVGKTGAGKSCSGNTILGREAFRAAAGHSSETAECSKQREKVFKRMVYVVDTPGFLDTSQKDYKVNREISKCINMSAPGPHAVLLVIEFGIFSKKERDAVMKVEEIFGKEVWKYTIILFTHGDKATDYEERLKNAPSNLQEILKKAGNRHHLFNNLNANNRHQVQVLFQKVQKMVDENRGEFFSNDKYQNTTETLDQREAEIKEFYKKKMEEEMKAVKAKYEEQREEQQEVKEQLESELEELKRYYRTLGSGVRQALEELTEDKDYEKFRQKFHKNLKLK